jgi:cell division transport system permease protein
VTALLRYSVSEALNSLARSWRASILAIGVIAAAVFAAGAVLLVSVNMDRVLARLSTTGELTVYLKQGTGPAGRDAVARVLADHPAVGSSTFVSSEDALTRFRRDLPELAALVGSFDDNPLPPAFEVRMRPGRSDEEARSVVRSLAATGSVEDVRYDRQVFDRLIDGLRMLRRAGLFLAAILGLAALVTITSVLRLAYLMRREEVEILFLVGLPPSAIRGPFVVEGVLLTAVGTLVAFILLYAAFGFTQAQIGDGIAQAFGIGGLVFVSASMLVLLGLVSMTVGGLAGLAAAWKEP